jgi:hypothetical protein
MKKAVKNSKLDDRIMPFNNPQIQKVSLLIVLLVTLTTYAADPPAVQWVQSFQSWDTIGNCVQTTPDNGYIAAGFVRKNAMFEIPNSDHFLWKIDSRGNILWRKNFGGPFIDKAFSVKRTSDGGYILVGLGGDTIQAIVVKTDSLGNQVWQHNGPANSDAGDVVQIEVQTGVGVGFVYTWESLWLADAGTYLTKLNAQGQFLWSRRVADDYKLTLPNRQPPLQQTSDGGFVTGTQQLVKTDTLGNVQWSRTYTDLPEIHSVRQTADAGFVATGCGPDPSDSRRTDVMVLLKTNSSGNKTWVKRFIWNQESWGLCVRQTTDDGYILSGQSDGPILVRTDSSGNVVWKMWPTQMGDARWCEQTPDGGYIFVSGEYLVKLAPETWRKRK